MQWAEHLISLRSPVLDPGFPYDHLLLSGNKLNILQDKAFVEQLIKDLVHGCSIVLWLYTGKSSIILPFGLRFTPFFVKKLVDANY